MSYRVEGYAGFNDEAEGGLQIGQSIELNQIFAWEELLGWEARNKYKGTSDAQTLYVAEEPGNTCERQCCKQARTTTMNIHMGEDEDAPVAVKMHKPFKMPCCCECGSCGEPELRIFAPGADVQKEWDTKALAQVHFPQTCALGLCGHIEQTVSINDHEVYHISGSACCSAPPCCDMELDIHDADTSEKVGEVIFHKQTCGEFCKKTNRFGVTFPDEAGPNEKAALVGATFLTDLWIEARRDQRENNNE
eukprot:gnl/MRDRNA2_/MRDRNA2_23177_c0_seq1.p1 gnl/MRDRNA2_/MRDRNA2_23177_c0~~gnl/MRDRNA2_/MRDRNA2_23177_c0_seq1.p1  ORF type:complete len:249 (+),score=39.67 gnl/MRDRNA2_/MRDRNA2_23177_c0_seq1:78-824(+)